MLLCYLEQESTVTQLPRPDIHIAAIQADVEGERTTSDHLHMILDIINHQVILQCANAEQQDHSMWDVTCSLQPAEAGVLSADNVDNLRAYTYPSWHQCVSTAQPNLHTWK